MSRSLHHHVSPRLQQTVRRALGMLVLMAGPAIGVPEARGVVLIEQDPNGYAGVPWGSSLAGRDEFSLADAGGRIERYDGPPQPPALDGIPVDAVQFFTIDGKFARVAVRYHGKATHDRIVEHLQQQYGPLDRTPGQMTRGLNIQHEWRGERTEINLQYQAQSDRGYVFFESRIHAPRFNDLLPEHGY